MDREEKGKGERRKKQEEREYIQAVLLAKHRKRLPFINRFNRRYLTKKITR